jgi:hypothetical protein
MQRTLADCSQERSYKELDAMPSAPFRKLIASSAAKAELLFLSSSARLKPCPFKATSGE